MVYYGRVLGNKTFNQPSLVKINSVQGHLESSLQIRHWWMINNDVKPMVCKRIMIKLYIAANV